MTRHTSRQGDRAGPVLEVLTLRQTSFRELLLVAFEVTALYANALGAEEWGIAASICGTGNIRWPHNT
jgi:hypothetical protein